MRSLSFRLDANTHRAFMSDDRLVGGWLCDNVETRRSKRPSASEMKCTLAASLFPRCDHQGNPAPQRLALFKLSQRGSHKCRNTGLHITAAAAKKSVADEVARVGRHAPLMFPKRNDVDVPGEAKRRLVSAAGRTSHDRGPTW